MNKLPKEKRAQVISLLVEGMSMRAITRVTGVNINTVSKLLVDAGEAADAYHQEHVRGIRGRRHIQCDEIWGFVYAKEGNLSRAKAAPEAAGDVWTFTALDSESKLVISYVVGPRDGQTALEFMDDLRSRIEDRPQISTDGLKAYREAVDGAFGGDVDFAQVIKEYGNPDDGDRSAKARYSPGQCTSIEKTAVWGSPDMRKANTSYVERNNLAIRMSVRRFTRLTNAFSKKLQNHCAMLSLYFYYANFIRPHGALKEKGKPALTPAQAAGITKRRHLFSDIVDLIEARAPKPNRPKTYRKRSVNSN